VGQMYTKVMPRRVNSAGLPGSIAVDAVGSRCRVPDG
jgi:hypothetical protein